MAAVPAMLGAVLGLDEFKQLTKAAYGMDRLWKIMS